MSTMIFLCLQFTRKNNTLPVSELDNLWNENTFFSSPSKQLGQSTSLQSKTKKKISNSQNVCFDEINYFLCICVLLNDLKYGKGLFQTSDGCNFCTQSSVVSFEIKNHQKWLKIIPTCLRGASKQNAFFYKNVPQKMHPCLYCLEQALTL